MRRYAIVFAVISLLLISAVVFCDSQMNFVKVATANKMGLFVLVNSVLLALVGIFFAVFHDRMKLYLKNYRREKKI